MEHLKTLLKLLLCVVMAGGLSGTLFSGSSLVSASLVCGFLLLAFPSEVLACIGSLFLLANRNREAILIADLGLRINRKEPVCLAVKSSVLLRAGRLKEAEEVVAIAQDNCTTDILQNIWAMKLLKGEIYSAMKYAEKLVATKPGHWAGYYARAWTSRYFSRNKKHEQMVSDSNKVFELTRSSAQAYLLRSVVNLSISKIDEGIEDALTAIKKNRISEFDEDYKQCLVCCYLEKNDVDSSVAILDELVKKKPVNELTVYLRAWMFLIQDMPEAALRDIEFLSDTEINLPAIIHAQGWALCRTNEVFQAYERAELLLERLPEWNYSYHLKASIHLRTSNLEEAHKTLEPCLKLDDFTSFNIALMAQICYQMQEYEKAIAYADKAFKLNKYCVQALRVKVLTLLALNKISDAEKWNEIADEIYCNDGFTWYCAGRIAIAKEDFYGAVEKFDRAIELDPHTKEYYLERSELYGKLGKLKESEKDKQKYCELKRKIDEQAALIIA